MFQPSSSLMYLFWYEKFLVFVPTMYNFLSIYMSLSSKQLFLSTVKFWIESNWNIFHAIFVTSLLIYSDKIIEIVWEYVHTYEQILILYLYHKSYFGEELVIEMPHNVEYFFKWGKIHCENQCTDHNNISCH